MNANHSFRRAFVMVALLAAFALSGCSDDSAASPSTKTDAGSTNAGSVVTFKDGPVQGDSIGGSRRFLKIPYAKPPIQDLRWKAPVKNDPWTSVRHETAFASACPQVMSQQAPMSTDEDCLYLNVWVPEPMPAKAPVMVWIHPGSNVAGSTSDVVPTTQQLWYDGQFFASRRGVVVVSMNYRLGPFGFFAHPALGAEHSPLGNQGLLDQRMALQWVQDNIAAFGGDKGNVTIFGESGGSTDVCYHVASPGDAGLFQRAISESGGCTAAITGKDPTAADAATGMTAFTKAMGCDTAPDVLACLRGKAVTDILANAMQPDDTSGGAQTAVVQWSFAVVVDGPGGFVPDQARTLFDTGKIAHVPYILGTNSDEGTLFLLNATSLTGESDYMAALQTRFPKAAVQVEAEYPASKFNGDYNAALARVVGDSAILCGTDDTARRAVKAGLPVYMYNFNIPWSIAPSVLKVAHASEVSHVFGDPVDGKTDSASQAVSDAMNAYWARFASTGDPNASSAPAVWPAFAPDASDNDKRLQFDSGWEILSDFRKEECAFWRQQYDAAYAN
jgi:para-nitrobenzyl esterase